MLLALIRLPIAAAFALLPAFQVAAQCKPAGSQDWLPHNEALQSLLDDCRCPNYLTSNSM